MTLLFEYEKWETISNTESLKSMLQDIWRNSKFVDTESETNEVESDNKYQPFLKFDGDQVRANNYVGFIQNGNELIEIFPKVFKNLPNAELKKEMMLRHIFYWFKYCRKWRFPFGRASLDTLEVDEFPELIINLIATQFFDFISQQPLTMYQPIEEALQTPRGSINFSKFVTNNMSRGYFHNVDCNYEPFLYDNQVNRVIKYCSRLLLNQTKFYENHRILQAVIFILDEVEDISCTMEQLERISLNSFFEDYSAVLDCCKLILSQQLYSSNSYDFSQWCLLFPMEYIFEDFFAGFLEAHFRNHWKVEYQKSNLYLSSSPRAFQMQHDIFLTSRINPEKQIIVDTKYKLRDFNFKNDIKKGVSQSDLYQMVSYAFRRGCLDVVLVYPNINEVLNEPDHFEIKSGFSGQENVRVTAIEIPFWSFADFEALETHLFETVEKSLVG